MTDQDILDYYNSLHLKMVEQIKLEAHKGINRMICIVREYGRKWEKHFKDNESINPQAFVQMTKERLLDGKWPADIKQALSHL